MMTCQDVATYLGLYIAGELAPAERDEFERHLGQCPPCRHYLESYQQTIALGKAALAPPVEPVADVPEALIRAILDARAAALRAP